MYKKIGSLGLALLITSGLSNAQGPNEHLLKVVQEGDGAGVTMAISAGADVNAQDKNGQSALIIAVRGNNTGTARRLLEKGANVNYMTPQGISPLMFAAQNRNKDMVQLLLENGADPRAEGPQGASMLGLARSGYDCDKEGTIRLIKEALKK